MASFHFDHAGQFTPAVGDPVTDSSGNARHGTEGSGISWSGDGVRGGAMVTSGAGSGAFFSVSFAPGMIAGDHFAISFWVKTAATGGTYNYRDWGRLDFSDGTSTEYAQLRSLPITVAGQDGGFYFRNPAYSYWPLNPRINLKDGQWHMVTVVADGNELTLYTDGGNPEVFDDYPRTAAFSLVGLRIGNGHPGGGGPGGSIAGLPGLLDEVRVFDGPLTAAEVAQLYATALAADESFLWNPAASGNAWLDAANWTGTQPWRAPGETPGPWSTNNDLATIGGFAFPPADGLAIDMHAAGGSLALGALAVASPGPVLRLGNGSVGTAGLLRLNGATVDGVDHTILQVNGAGDFHLAAATTAGAPRPLELVLGGRGHVIHVAPGRTIRIDADIRAAEPGAGLALDGGGSLVLAGVVGPTGETRIENGELTLAGSGSLTFALGRSGTNTRVTGTGVAAFDGTFHLLLDGDIPRLHGSSWNLVDIGTRTFGAGFAITSDLGGFTRTGDTHELITADRHWVFSQATGNLTLSAPAADTFTGWIDGFFPGEIAAHMVGPRADPDNDDIPNLIELVVGGDPGSADRHEVLPVPKRVRDPANLPAGEYLLFSFRRAAASVAAGIETRVELSADLASWQPVADGQAGAAVVVTPDGHGAGIDLLDAWLPVGDESRGFARLAATDTRAPADPNQAPPAIRFGVISDVHSGYAPAASGFLTSFIDDMSAWEPGFIIQLGDFCRPEPASNAFMAIYNSWPGPKYHVIGNHERDGGYTLQQAADYWGMPARYHTFDHGPVRAIVLDGNEPGGSGSGYAAFVGTAQQDWLAAQLAATDRPVVIFIHQPIESLENGPSVQAVIDAAEQARPGTVLAVLSGHLHQDYALVINGIPYIQINSATYVYYNGRVEYSEPLWARVTVDFETLELSVQGRQSSWSAADPWQLGAPESIYPRDKVRPAISNRTFTIREASADMAYGAYFSPVP